MPKQSKSYLTHIPRTLNERNIENAITDYLQILREVRFPVFENNIYNLLRALKRDELQTGPYIGVSAFEAANRIMTDLTILYGVKQLLQDPRFCQFSEYKVEFGNENNNQHDISSSSGEIQLHGEAFNVAPSFFTNKKNKSLKKLRDLKKESKRDKDLLLILYNADATLTSEPIKTSEDEYFVSVDIELPELGS